MTTAKKLLTAFEEFKPHINGHNGAIDLFLEAVDEVSDLQDALNILTEKRDGEMERRNAN